MNEPKPELFTFEDPNFVILLALLAFLVGLIIWAVPARSWPRPLAHRRVLREDRRRAREVNLLYDDLDLADQRLWELRRLREIGQLRRVGLVELHRLEDTRREIHARLIQLGAPWTDDLRPRGVEPTTSTTRGAA